jgi:tight adherence protein B
MKRRVLAAALSLAVVALAGTPAWAGSSGGTPGPPAGVTVRDVDTRQFPTVRLNVLVSGKAAAPADFNVRENGALVRNPQIRPLKQTASPVGTVLVIDTSGSMKSRGAMDQAKTAARQFIASKAANDWIALVSFSSQALIRSDFTQDGAALTAAVDGLQAVGETALWDGLATAGRLYDKSPDLQPNVVLLSDGADTVSSGTEAEAVAALGTAHATMFAIGIASDEFDPAGLSSVVGAAGGFLTTSADPADLGAQFGKIRSALENQYEIVYTSKGDGGELELDLAVGGLAAHVQTRAGSAGAASAPPVVVGRGGLFSAAGSKYVILLLAALAATVLGAAGLLIFARRESSIEDRLAIYTDPGAAESSSSPANRLAENGLVQMAVRLTSRFAERGGLLVKVEDMLEQANLPLRPAEALFFYGAGVFLVGLMAVFGAPNKALGLVVAVIVAVLPLLVVKFLRSHRLKAFELQLPDTLNLLSGSLRAGYSFPQGMEAVVQETSDPMRRELRRVLTEARLGRTLEDAMGDVAIRMQSRDFEWSVLAIRIQREVGGNLAELLQTVADTMVQRTRMRGEIKALTAEGRISGIIMGLLPVGLGLFMFTVSPDYLNTLFSSFIGWAMVIGSIVMAAAGFAWIQKIIKIEV